MKLRGPKAKGNRVVAKNLKEDAMKLRAPKANEIKRSTIHAPPKHGETGCCKKNRKAGATKLRAPKANEIKHFSIHAPKKREKTGC